jgi:hypothetical protein
VLISSRGRLGGLAEAPVEGPELFPGQLRPGNTFDTGQSTLTVGPMTIVSKVAPKKIGPGGKVTIWGLPPMVAYAIMAVTVTGAGLWAYQLVKGRGRRVAPNPPRRSGARGKRPRYKR